jgi:CBS domain-containing membrane protein
VAIAGFICIATLGTLALLTRMPWIFPSLGATAFLLLTAPRTAAACPRNTLCAHAIAIACGYGSLLVTGLADAPPVVVTGMDGPRILATALSLGCTAGLMVLLDVGHAPAGATTLIVSLGFSTQPIPLLLLVVEGAVLVLVAMAWIVHHLLGMPYPVWAHPPALTAVPGLPQEDSRQAKVDGARGMR